MARDTQLPCMDRFAPVELEALGTSPRCVLGWSEWDGQDFTQGVLAREWPAPSEPTAPPAPVGLPAREDLAWGGEDEDGLDFDCAVASF